MEEEQSNDFQSQTTTTQPQTIHQQNQSEQQDQPIEIEQEPSVYIRRMKNLSNLSEKCQFLNTCEEKQFCCRNNSQKTLLAIGSEDNIIRVYDTKNQLCNHLMLDKPTYVLQNDHKNDFSSVTNLCWKPFVEGMNVQNILISTHSNGELIFWHVTGSTSFNLGKMIKRVKESNNVINCIDYNPKGVQFATGGQDSTVKSLNQVKLYDENRTQSPTILKASEMAPSHANRVYGVKFIDDNTLMSAGWDKTILIWDVRCKESVSYIYGPEICGDSLDYNNNKILAGNFRENNQIQVFDLRTLRCMKTVDFFEDDMDQQYIYAAKFSPSGKYIVTGSAGQNQLNLINQDFQIERDIQCDQGVYSLDFIDEKRVALCGGQGLAGIYSF